MMKYIPKETRIYTTGKVENIFEKLAIEGEDQQQDEDVPESQMTEV